MTEENYKKAQEIQLRIASLEHLKMRIISTREHLNIKFEISFSIFGPQAKDVNKIIPLLNDYSQEEDLDFLIEQIDNRIQRLKNEFLQL